MQFKNFASQLQSKQIFFEKKHFKHVKVIYKIRKKSAENIYQNKIFSKPTAFFFNFL